MVRQRFSSYDLARGYGRSGLEDRFGAGRYDVRPYLLSFRPSWIERQMLIRVMPFL
jgi:hypothetical protein